MKECEGCTLSNIAGVGPFCPTHRDMAYEGLSKEPHNWVAVRYKKVSANETVVSALYCPHCKEVEEVDISIAVE